MFLKIINTVNIWDLENSLTYNMSFKILKLQIARITLLLYMCSCNQEKETEKVQELIDFHPIRECDQGYTGLTVTVAKLYQGETIILKYNGNYLHTSTGKRKDISNSYTTFLCIKPMRGKRLQLLTKFQQKTIIDTSFYLSPKPSSYSLSISLSIPRDPKLAKQRPLPPEVVKNLTIENTRRIIRLESDSLWSSVTP